MRAIAQRNRGRGARDFLDRDHMRQIGHADAAEFLGHGDAQEAKIAHFFPEFVGKGVAGVDLCRHRLDALLRPAMHHLAQGIHILAQIELHDCVEHRPLPLRRNLLNTCSFYSHTSRVGSTGLGVSSVSRSISGREQSGSG